MRLPCCNAFIATLGVCLDTPSCSFQLQAPSYKTTLGSPSSPALRSAETQSPTVDAVAAHQVMVVGGGAGAGFDGDALVADPALLLGQGVIWQRSCLHIFCDSWRTESAAQYRSMVPQHVANDNACSKASKGCRCVHSHTMLQKEVAGVGSAPSRGALQLHWKCRHECAHRKWARSGRKMMHQNSACIAT